jgi:DNA-binding Lrp family transcriptional regulator
MNITKMTPADYRKMQVAEIIGREPGIGIAAIAKRLGCSPSRIRKDVSRLEKENHPNIALRNNMRIKGQKKEAERRLMIREYYQKNPGVSYVEAAKALNLDTRTIRQDVAFMVRSGEAGAVIFQDPQIIQERNYLKVAEFYEKNPTGTQYECARYVGVCQKTISNYVREMSARIQQESSDRWGLHLNSIIEQHMTVIKECDDRLEKCTKPTTGARWVELKQASLRELAKIYKLTGPDIQVNVANLISKEDRDKVVEAAIVDSDEVFDLPEATVDEENDLVPEEA